MSAVERFDVAEAILERYGVEEMLDVRSLVLHSKTYLTFLAQTFQATKVYKKYPVRYHYKNRLFEKTVDLILETANGVVIIQNSGFASVFFAFSIRRWISGIGCEGGSND